MSVKECSINAKSRTTLKATEKALYREISDCQSEKLSCRTNYLSVNINKFKFPGKFVTTLADTHRSFAVFQVRRSPVSIALLSFFFHCSATSFARGSSGLGALNNAWIDSNTVRICKAGDHLSERHTRKEYLEPLHITVSFSTPFLTSEARKLLDWFLTGEHQERRLFFFTFQNV